MAGRPQGAKDADHANKRRALLSRINRACLADPAKSLSLREMAASAEVSVPTLKHYFSDRDGVVTAVLEQAWLDAAALLAPSFDAKQSIGARVKAELAQFQLAVTQFGLDRLHVWGMSEGLASALSGPAYLQFFLEPTLQNAEYWLEEYRKIGSTDPALDVRHAAITLYAPCLVLVMHQDYLGGRELRKADVGTFLTDHGERFLRYVGAQ